MNKYKRLSRPPLAIMVLLAVVSCLAVPDADCWASNGLVQMQIASRTKLDVSKGNIKIGASKISGLNPEGKQETQVNREGYHITGETGAYSITIEEGVTADILLDNVNISLVDEDACALKIAEASKGDVTVTLRGQNVLKSGSHCAGLEKSCNQTSCVRAKSQCTCGTLTIQCEKYNETGHICDEDCGSLIASGVNGGAGIGGGDGRKANRIQILGGRISSSGGYGGAGIGGGYFCGGSNIEITGGEVTTVSGEGNVSLGGLDGSENNTINGDCIVEAASTGGVTVSKGILLNGNSGTIHGTTGIARESASGVLKDKTLTREDGGRLILPEGVAWTVQNTLRDLSDPSFSVRTALSANERTVSAPQTQAQEEEEEDETQEEKKETAISQTQTASANGIYGQTLSQLEVTDAFVQGGIPGTWEWADTPDPDKTYPIVNGTTSYIRVFTPDSPEHQKIQVKILPQISYLETNKQVSILSPRTPNGENGWYKGNVVLEAPDGYQAFHSRSVGWVEELVVPDDGGSGDYEYYLREVGTNQTTNVKTIRLNIDSLPPVVETVTVMHVEGGMRIRAKARDDTSVTKQVSGPRRFYFLVKPESPAKSLATKSVVKNKKTKNNTDGEFTYTDLEAGTSYRLYVVAADAAGNLSEVYEQTFIAQ